MTPQQSQFEIATQKATEESQGQQNSLWQKVFSCNSEPKSSHSTILVWQSVMVTNIDRTDGLVIKDYDGSSKHSFFDGRTSSRDMKEAGRSRLASRGRLLSTSTDPQPTRWIGRSKSPGVEELHRIKFFDMSFTVVHTELEARIESTSLCKQIRFHQID